MFFKYYNTNIIIITFHPYTYDAGIATTYTSYTYIVHRDAGIAADVLLM